MSRAGNFQREKNPPYLPDAVKALALAELVFRLPGALFGLLEAAHRVGLLAVAEEDVAQVEVGAVKVLQQLPFSLRERESLISQCFLRTWRRGGVRRGLTLQ